MQIHTPENQAKAQAAKRRRPLGKRQTKYENVELPAPWLQEAAGVLRSPLRPKERHALAALATQKLGRIMDDVFDEVVRILKNPGNRDDAAKVQLINKLLDKTLPDLMTDADQAANSASTTKIMFGVPLDRVRNGGTVQAALKITQPEETPHD